MVVVLGIAILGMTGIIIVKGIEKFGESEDSGQTPTSAKPARTVAPAPAGEAWQADIGAGRIVSAEVNDGLLMLLIEDAEGVRRVEVRDLATGKIRGRAVTE